MKSDQNVVFDVTGYDGDVTKIVETIPSHSGGGALISRLASYQGLILISSERSEYTVTTTFEPHYAAFSRYPLGQKRFLRRAVALTGTQRQSRA